MNIIKLPKQLQPIVISQYTLFLYKKDMRPKNITNIHPKNNPADDNLISRHISQNIFGDDSKYYLLNQFYLNTTTILDISNSNLNHIPNFIIHLFNLLLLRLDNNIISVIPNFIGELTSLTTLSLRYNKITSIPEDIYKLYNLTLLDLSFNNLLSLPENNIKPGQPYNSPHPPFLSCIEPTTLISLKQFNLSDNKLISLPSTLNNFIALEVLDLTNNQLIDFPTFSTHSLNKPISLLLDGNLLENVLNQDQLLLKSTMPITIRIGNVLQLYSLAEKVMLKSGRELSPLHEYELVFSNPSIFDSNLTSISIGTCNVQIKIKAACSSNSCCITSNYYTINVIGDLSLVPNKITTLDVNKVIKNTVRVPLELSSIIDINRNIIVTESDLIGHSLFISGYIKREIIYITSSNINAYLNNSNIIENKINKIELTCNFSSMITLPFKSNLSPTLSRNKSKLFSNPINNIYYCNTTNLANINVYESESNDLNYPIVSNLDDYKIIDTLSLKELAHDNGSYFMLTEYTTLVIKVSLFKYIYVYL